GTERSRFGSARWTKRVPVCSLRPLGLDLEAVLLGEEYPETDVVVKNIQLHFGDGLDLRVVGVGLVQVLPSVEVRPQFRVVDEDLVQCQHIRQAAFLDQDACLDGQGTRLLLGGPDGDDDRGKAQGTDDQGGGAERDGQASLWRAAAETTGRNG